MKILLDIPVALYDKVIQGKADKRTMMTVIGTGKVLGGKDLGGKDRILMESEIIAALNAKKKNLELYNDWGRVYGVMIARDIIKELPEVAP